MINEKELAYQLRQNAVHIIMAGGGGHIGGDMSEMEILMSLYFHQMNVDPQNPEDPDRDMFILSKGHSMEAYYAVLCERGFLDYNEVISKFSRFNTRYIGHPNNKLPGIEMNSGSLGHGLPVGVGMALAAKMDHKDKRVYVLTGDGELAEGSNWEGFMSGAMYKLDNLCVIIDRNTLQLTGRTEDLMAVDDLDAKLRAFNWNVIHAQGNDLTDLNRAFEAAKAFRGKPSVIIAHTIKGLGSPVMQDKAGWHHRTPTQEEYHQIIADLEERRKELAE